MSVVLIILMTWGETVTMQQVEFRTVQACMAAAAQFQADKARRVNERHKPPVVHSIGCYVR